MSVRKMMSLMAACCILAAPLCLAAQQPVPVSPRQMPPGTRLPEVSPEKFRKAVAEKLASSKGRAAARIKNPNAGDKGVRPSLVEALRQQRLAAVSAHTAAIGVEKTQSSSGQSGSGAVMLAPAHPVLLAQPQPASPSSKLEPTTVGGQMVPKVQTNIAPGQALKGSGNYRTQPTPAPTGITHQTDPRWLAPHPLTMCMGPGVRAVNSHPKGVLFTPIQDYNSYIITGCLFGSQSGQAYLIGKFRAQQINLQIQYWTDNEIDARVDPNISGELDQDNVSLVIAPAGAAQMKAPGFKFMAARSDPAVLLSSIPSSWAKLQPVSVTLPNHFYPQTVPVSYSSPANVPQATGDSAFVSRYFDHKFSPGSDYYDFSQLASGWTTDSMQFSSYDEDSCPWIVTYKQSFGNAFPEWSGDNIKVFWSDTSCSGFMPHPILGIPAAIYADHTGSYYALNVWVRGPRCTDPYSGKAQPQCIQNVQMCGNETCGP